MRGGRGPAARLRRRRADPHISPAPPGRPHGTTPHQEYSPQIHSCTFNFENGYPLSPETMPGGGGGGGAVPLLGPAAAQRALGAVRSARAVYSSVAGGIVTDP